MLTSATIITFVQSQMKEQNYMIVIILFFKLDFRLATYFQFYHCNSLSQNGGSIQLKNSCFRNMLMIPKWSCLKFVFFRIFRSLQMKPMIQITTFGLIQYLHFIPVATTHTRSFFDNMSICCCFFSSKSLNSVGASEVFLRCC